MKLGRHAKYGDHFAGIIDDVRIYNYVLSETDIAKIFAGEELAKSEN